MSRESGSLSRLRAAALLVAAVAPMLLVGGCLRGRTPVEPGAAPPPSPTSPAARPGAALTAPPPAGAEGFPGTAAPAPQAAPQAPPAAADRRGEPTAAPGGAAPADESGPSPASSPAEAKAGDATPAPASPEAGNDGKAVEGATAARPEGGDPALRGGVPKAPEGRPAHVAVARLPESLSFDHDGPYWARGREELVYRVEFLGMTMGYARFVFNGKVLLGGREVYHLSVRAWTSNVLALIYPVNDTIDYYMDIKTLEPLRQEYTSGNRKKDDVTIYDQETGRIVYRYKESGEIRKQVNAVPNVYDPVTLAYFFRSRDPAAGEKGRNVYAGRKVWEISASPLGVEKIVTDRGEVETFVIRPVIKRDGKVEDKGDLRMWMTRDERRIPVRLYAKFRKIRTWTLVGELMPEKKGG